MTFSFVKYRLISLQPTNQGVGLHSIYNTHPNSDTESVASRDSADSADTIITDMCILGAYLNTSNHPEVPQYIFEFNQALRNSLLPPQNRPLPDDVRVADWDFPCFLRTVFFDLEESQTMVDSYRRLIQNSNDLIISHITGCGASVGSETNLKDALIVLLALEPRSKNLAVWCSNMMMGYVVYPIIELLQSNPHFLSIESSTLSRSLNEMSHSMLLLLYWNCLVDDLADVIKNVELVNLCADLTMQQFDAKVQSQPFKFDGHSPFYDDFIRKALAFSDKFMDIFLLHAKGNPQLIAQQRVHLELLCQCMRDSVALTASSNPTQHIANVANVPLQNDHKLSPLMDTFSENMQVKVIAYSAMVAITNAYCNTTATPCQEAFDLLFPSSDQLLQVIKQSQDFSRIANNYGSLWREARSCDITNILFHKVIPQTGASLDSPFSDDVITNELLSPGYSNSLITHLLQLLVLLPSKRDESNVQTMCDHFLGLIRGFKTVSKDIDNLGRHSDFFAMEYNDLLVSLQSLIIFKLAKDCAYNEVSDFLINWAASDKLNVQVQDYLVSISNTMQLMAEPLKSERFDRALQIMTRVLMMAYIDAQNLRNGTT